MGKMKNPDGAGFLYIVRLAYQAHDTANNIHL